MTDTLSLFDEQPVLVPSPRPARPLTIQEGFEAFHRANPWVYEALRRLAVDLANRGHERIGIGMLFEVLRWHYTRATHGDEFKLNNNYRSRYARRLMDREPGLAGRFETRELRSR